MRNHIYRGVSNKRDMVPQWVPYLSDSLKDQLQLQYLVALVKISLV